MNLTTNIPKNLILDLPCIKKSINFKGTGSNDGNMKSTNDFDLMMETNTSSAQCTQLCGNGSVWPEILPVLCDNYKQSKWNCTNVWIQKLALLGLNNS